MFYTFTYTCTCLSVDKPVVRGYNLRMRTTLLCFLFALVAAVGARWASYGGKSPQVFQWEEKKDAGVQCHFCPYECYLPEGFVGRCGARVNDGQREKLIPVGSGEYLSPSSEAMPG